MINVMYRTADGYGELDYVENIKQKLRDSIKYYLSQGVPPPREENKPAAGNRYNGRQH
jgi:hypothetical protein